jgi:hypothetical protein
MAPSNEYLNNDENRQRLTDADPHMVRCSSVWYPGEDPTFHYDFERAVELGRLADFLARYSGPDFEDGKVTVTNAVQTVYLYEDPYLTSRTLGHLALGRGEFNVKYTDGVAYYVRDDGTIARDDKETLATRWLQGRADTRRSTMDRASLREARGVDRESTRAKKLAPAITGQLDGIKHQWGHEMVAIVERRAREALGTPVDDNE